MSPREAAWTRVMSVVNVCSAMNSQRVLVVLGTDAAWSRGVLRGFMAASRERDWTLLHYDPPNSLSWLVDEWAPTAALVGPELGLDAIGRLSPTALVSVTVDRSADGIASVCPDEDGIAAFALEHLITTGLKHVTIFRFDDSPFAVARESAFLEQARSVNVQVVRGWGGPEYTPSERGERPAAIVAWLRTLPKPCGMFTCTDSWGRVVARYAREAGLRVPEDLALVGADNDVLKCELISPPLSSVMIPWQELGYNRDQSTNGRRSLGLDIPLHAFIAVGANKYQCRIAARGPDADPERLGADGLKPAYSLVSDNPTRKEWEPPTLLLMGECERFDALSRRDVFHEHHLVHGLFLAKPQGNFGAFGSVAGSPEDTLIAG